MYCTAHAPTYVGTYSNVKQNASAAICSYIVFCVGGSNAPPILYWPYSTLSGHMTNTAHLGEAHDQYRTLRQWPIENTSHVMLFKYGESHDKQLPSRWQTRLPNFACMYWDDTLGDFHQCIRLGWRRKMAAFTLFRWLFECKYSTMFEFVYTGKGHIHL